MAPMLNSPGVTWAFGIQADLLDPSESPSAGNILRHAPCRRPLVNCSVDHIIEQLSHCYVELKHREALRSTASQRGRLGAEERVASHEPDSISSWNSVYSRSDDSKRPYRLTCQWPFDLSRNVKGGLTRVFGVGWLRFSPTCGVLPPIEGPAFNEGHSKKCTLVYKKRGVVKNRI
ncbi:hypothetical protein M8818_002200 [Zalaria obscura]|uniref:Uncharacterized protein n=1 Tax=Zalaria obscura TaxID=2024903 RepID=A0ACC3SIP7_9PEZI